MNALITRLSDAGPFSTKHSVLQQNFIDSWVHAFSKREWRFLCVDLL